MTIEETWRPIFEAMDTYELSEVGQVASEVYRERTGRGRPIHHVPGSGYTATKGPPVWFFRVKSVDPSAKGMDAFEGEFLSVKSVEDDPHPKAKSRQRELDSGDIIIACARDGHGNKRYGIGPFEDRVVQSLAGSGGAAEIRGVSIGRRFSDKFSDIIKWAEGLGVPSSDEKEAPA